MTPTDLDQLVAALSTPFHADPGFWIGLVVGVVGIVVSAVGLWFSLRAFREAREAKLAAREAGRTVKRQTIVVELTEVTQRLDQIERDIDFLTARQRLNDASRRVHRLLAAYRDHEGYTQACTELFNALTHARQQLETAYPEQPGSKPEGTPVYFAVESGFASVSDRIATIIGLFENQSIESQDERHA